jgi:hypothetical protein
VQAARSRLAACLRDDRERTVSIRSVSRVHAQFVEDEHADIISLILLVALAAFMVWIGWRALQVQSRVLRWSGVGLAAVLTILVSSVSALTATGLVKQHARSAPLPSVKVELTPERIARGNLGGCADAPLVLESF